MAEKDKKSRGISKEFGLLDAAAKKLLSMLDPSYSEREELSKKNYAIQKIVNRELDLMKGVSEGSIIDFIMSVDARNSDMIGFGSNSNTREAKNPIFDNIFVDNMSDIISLYQESYKNKYLELADLKMISKFVPSMSKAVRITLSSITNSDNISDTILRNIVFPSGTSEDDRAAIMTEIQANEKDLKLLKKLKNTVFKRTLVGGSFYVYAVPYKKIFEEFQRMKDAGRCGGTAANGFTTAPLAKKGIAINKKSTMVPGMESISFDGLPIEDSNVIENTIESLGIDNVYIYSDTNVLIDALEGDLPTSYRRMFGEADQSNKFQSTSDATFNLGDGKKSKRNKSNAYNDISGTYIKYIDPKYIVPCVIFEHLVGYFYVRPSAGKNVSIMTPKFNANTKNGVFASGNIEENKKEKSLSVIADKISEGVLNAYSEQFIHGNIQHKELIAECILSNGLANNEYHIQFIPAEDMIPFVINEDDTGEGESILSDALYPARLLFDLITCKLLNYFNKSGNKTYAHIHKGPIGTNEDNMMQRVLRMLQQQNINFNDLLSTNMIFSKFSRDSNIQLPMSKNGNKLVEFETQEGQEIDLTTPMEEKLEKMAIQGTPVPASFMDRIDDTQFAKQITSDHIEFAGVISSLQADLEEPTTILYRKIIENSSLSDDVKLIGKKIEFKLPRPKVLQQINDTEFLSNTITNAESIAKLFYGDTPDENMQKHRNIFIRKVCEQNIPYFEWDKYKELFEESGHEAEKEKNYKESATGGADDLGSL